MLAFLALLAWQTPQEPPANPSEEVVKGRYLLFTNAIATVSPTGQNRRTYSAMLPWGELTVLTEEGGRRRTFTMDCGQRQEAYGYYPDNQRSGQSGPQVFAQLTSEWDGKGLLQSARVVEEFRIFETGLDYPYVALRDRPIAGLRMTFALSRETDRYALASRTERPGSLPQTSAQRVRPAMDQPLWTEALEPFLADRAWVRKLLVDAKEKKPVTYQVGDRYGAVINLKAHVYGLERVSFAGWTKELIRVDLEHLGTNIKAKKYAGTAWLLENGMLELAAIEAGGMLSVGTFVARDSGEFAKATFWPYFEHERTIKAR